MHVQRLFIFKLKNPDSKIESLKSESNTAEKQTASSYEKETRTKVGYPFNANVIGFERATLAVI
jgi:hypothetical protein